MNHDIRHTLLHLCDQIIAHPETLPDVLVNAHDAFPEGSDERELLQRFHAMLNALNSREAQYLNIFDATTDALIVNNPDGYVVEANTAACTLLGYTRDEFIGKHYSAFIPAELHSYVARYLKKVLANGQLQTRTVGIRRDGSSFQAETQGTPFTYQGKLHIVSAFRDITERLHTEEQLREQEEQYRAIFEASTDALFIQDMEDGRIVEVNPAACKMHGFTYEEFIGLLPPAFIHPSSASLVAESLQTIQSGATYHARGVSLHKDGTSFLTEAHVTMFLYKGRPHLLSVVRDITEEVVAEQQLKEQEAQYRSIFEATTDGLFITDPDDGHLVEVNPAAYQMHGYTYNEFINMHPTACIHPDSHPIFAEYIQTVKSGGKFYAQAADIRKDGSSFPIEVHGTQFTYKGKVHVLGIVRDITERKQAEEQLREKEAQYRSIFEASSDGLVINDLEYGHLVEANPAMCRMHGYTCEEFMSLHPTGFIHPNSLPIFAEYLETVKAGREFQTTAIDIRKDGTPFPVEVHGTTFTYKGKPHVLAVVRDITEQEQAYQLLEQRVEERTHELTTLLEVSHSVAATIELRPLLGLVLDQLKVVADYTGSSFSIVEGENLILVDNRGPAPLEQVLQLQLPIKGMGLIWEMFCHQEPVIIADVHGDEPLAQAFRAWMKERMKTTFGYIRSWMGIPLTLKEQVIGMLTLSSYELNFYTSQHARMAMAIASQAAVAIENARLYEQAQDLAAIQERQRLARELHDSVSQALYGISLGTHTARTLLDRDPRKVAEPLDYVLSLADAALVEMRALIFELRPESLEAEGLVSVLRKQAAALQARHGIEVSTQLCEEPEAPLKVKKELHRVAQEALHNTVKHAQASKVELRLDSTSEGIFLEMRDNGIGFDPQAYFPGHLGLQSMRERIAGLGAVLQLESSPGLGTYIRVWVPAEGIAKRKTDILS